MAPWAQKKCEVCRMGNDKEANLGDVAEVLNSRYQKPIEKFRRTNATTKI